MENKGEDGFLLMNEEKEEVDTEVLSKKTISPAHTDARVGNEVKHPPPLFPKSPEDGGPPKQ